MGYYYALLTANLEGMSDHHPETAVGEYQLTLGDLAPEGESFCPWQTVKKYPYTFVGVASRSKVTIPLRTTFILSNANPL